MQVNLRYRILIILTVLSIGRAMTLPFITRAGDGGPGDPPSAWLMPLLADATIGIAAIAVVVALVRGRTPAVWAGAIAFHAIAAFDALAALLVEVQTPWPDFFMIQAFGRAMFIGAAAMHLVALVLLGSAEVRSRFAVLGTESTAHTGGVEDQSLASMKLRTRG